MKPIKHMLLGIAIILSAIAFGVITIQVMMHGGFDSEALIVLLLAIIGLVVVIYGFIKKD